jgi:hypothetical protein
MAITARRTEKARLVALITAYNLWKREVTETLTSYPHCDVSSKTTWDDVSPTTTPDICSSASATTLPTVILRANNAKAVWNRHVADAVAHKAADSTNVITSPNASDQTTSNTLLNELKADINLHMSQAGVHFTDDGINAVSSPDASDLGTSETLANEIYTVINAHIQFGPDSPSVKITAA